MKPAAFRVAEPVPEVTTPGPPADTVISEPAPVAVTESVPPLDARPVTPVPTITSALPVKERFIAEPAFVPDTVYTPPLVVILGTALVILEKAKVPVPAEVESTVKLLVVPLP